MVVVLTHVHAPAAVPQPARLDARPAPPNILRLNIGTLTTLLWLAATVVIGLGVARELLLQTISADSPLKDLRHFAFDAEHSLPAWFEAIILAAASGLLAVLAGLSRRHDPENFRHWTLLAVTFLLLSIDEAVAFHEATMAPLRQTFNFTGFLYFSWVVIAVPLLLAFTVYFIPFLRRLPHHVALRFLIAGAMFVGGALGLEFIGGYLVSHGGFDQPLYKLVSAAEECLEIAGATLFVSSLLQHLSECSPVLEIEFARRP